MSEQEQTKTTFDSQIIFVPVADLARSAQFYETVLLLKPTLDQHGIKIYQVVERSFLGFCQNEAPLAADDRLIFTFVTERVDEWHTRLLAQGVPTDGPPRTNERYQIYHFFARDPDGYRIEVQRFLHPFP
jgi:catechol 2,3-dioxygenase-like lactoylglutathione lyase family enzyme